MLEQACGQSMLPLPGQLSPGVQPAQHTVNLPELQRTSAAQPLSLLHGPGSIPVHHDRPSPMLPPGVTLSELLPNVPAPVNQKVQRGSYVDLRFTFPPNFRNIPSFEQSEAEWDKTLRNLSPIRSIGEWLEAFIVYIALVAGWYPEKVKDMVGYALSICEAQRNGSGQGWSEYDNLFRSRADMSAEWARINQGLWATTVNRPRPSPGIRVKSSVGSSSSSQACSDAPKPAVPPKVRDQFCFAWNSYKCILKN